MIYPTALDPYWNEYGNMFHEHNLEAKFHRSIVLQPLTRKILQELTPGNIWHCVWRGQWTTAKTTIVHSLYTGSQSVVGVPFVIFFPAPTKLEELIPAGMVKHGLNRVQLPLWLQQSLIYNRYFMEWYVLGHSGQQTSICKVCSDRVELQSHKGIA